MSENDDVRKDGYYLCLGHDESNQMWMEQLVSIKGKIRRLTKIDRLSGGKFALVEVNGIDEVLIDSYKPL